MKVEQAQMYEGQIESAVGHLNDLIRKAAENGMATTLIICSVEPVGKSAYDVLEVECNIRPSDLEI